MSMFLAVLLAWDLSTGVTGYKIYWRFRGDDWGSHVVDVGNVTQAEIDEPWPTGSKVEFRCTAYNATGESGPSNVVEWHVTGNNK
jgi:hypothetical protein